MKNIAMLRWMNHLIFKSQHSFGAASDVVVFWLKNVLWPLEPKNSDHAKFLRVKSGEG